MSVDLMPSQIRIYQTIIAKEDKYFRRNNTILFGGSQIGKTELLKYISYQDKSYKYINFTREHLKDFLSNKRLANVNFNDLQDYLRSVFDNDDSKNRKIILDEIDSIVTVIAGNDDFKLLSLYRQFLDMDLSIEFMFATSVFEDFILSNLNENFKDRIYLLDFNKFDKEHIIKNIFSNIHLFDLETIVNLRQLLNR